MINTSQQCRQFSCGCNGLKLHNGQEGQSSRRSFIQQLGGLGAGAVIGGAGGAYKGNESQEAVVKRCLSGRGYKVLN